MHHGAHSQNIQIINYHFTFGTEHYHTHETQTSSIDSGEKIIIESVLS